MGIKPIKFVGYSSYYMTLQQYIAGKNIAALCCCSCCMPQGIL